MNCAAAGTRNLWPLGWNIDAVRHSHYRDSQPELPQVAGFGVASCNMATRLRQIASLVELPSKMFLKPLVAKGPRLKHATRAHYPWNAELFCENSEAVIMEQPNPIIVENVGFAEAIQGPRWVSTQASECRIGR
jgi:hypothetical protein